MEVFEIEGGKRLAGEINVRGSKNAATPILAATLLTQETCVLSNLPLIEDVFCMLDILRSMGAEVEWRGKRRVAITAKQIDPKKVDIQAVKKSVPPFYFWGRSRRVLIISRLDGRADA